MSQPVKAWRIVPADGKNPYAHHPGFMASGCHLRYTVTPAYFSTSSHGFGCEANGGHCVPGEQCDGLRERFPVEIGKEMSNG